MTLERRVALITGSGSSGMGRAYCQVLGRRGSTIVVTDIDDNGCAETVRLLEQEGIPSTAMPCDITDPVAVNRMIGKIDDKFGRLDVLINNAGVGQHANIEEITDEMLDRMMRVHLYGTFYCCRATVPIMKRQGHGKILNVSSIWGMTGWHRASHYCAAKAAILGLTKALAQELASSQINVNAIAPGAVLTPMSRGRYSPEAIERERAEIPWGRWAEPIEIAYVGAFLCSDEADFITGQVVSPNGGQTIVGI